MNIENADQSSEIKNDHAEMSDGKSEEPIITESSELTACTESLKVCQQELEQLKNNYHRMMADFENIKKRMEKERQQWTRRAQAEILIGLLPIVDNFERALAENEREKISPALQAWFEGFQLMYKELLKYLEHVGVTPIIAQEFDPSLHEAIVSIESEKPSGHIVEILQKGYMFQDHVLRPAKVSIAK